MAKQGLTSADTCLDIIMLVSLCTAMLDGVSIGKVVVGIWYITASTNVPLMTYRFIMASTACLVCTTYGAPTIGDYRHLNR